MYVPFLLYYYLVTIYSNPILYPIAGSDEDTAPPAVLAVAPAERRAARVAARVAARAARTAARTAPVVPVVTPVVPVPAERYDTGTASNPVLTALGETIRM